MDVKSGKFVRRSHMRRRQHLNLSRSFREVYRQWFESGCKSDVGLKLVDDFLNQYPWYPEALIFKARLLMGERDEEALWFLREAKNIDEWRATHCFDEAEILYKSGKRKQAITVLEKGIESLLRQLTDGIDNFLVGIGRITDKNDPSYKEILHQISSVIAAWEPTVSLKQFEQIIAKEKPKDRSENSKGLKLRVRRRNRS